MSKINSLLAELDAEFGKQKKTKGKAVDKNSIVKSLNKEFHQRNATGGLSDLLAASNKTAKSWAQVPGFRATRRITYVVHQHCCTCSHSVSYVGNIFTEFESKRLRAKVKSPELILVDEFGFDLPHTVEETHMDIPECVQCLQLSRRAEDLAAQLILSATSGYQTGLLFGVHDERV